MSSFQLEFPERADRRRLAGELASSSTDDDPPDDVNDCSRAKWIVAPPSACARAWRGNSAIEDTQRWFRPQVIPILIESDRFQCASASRCNPTAAMTSPTPQISVTVGIWVNRTDADGRDGRREQRDKKGVREALHPGRAS